MIVALLKLFARIEILVASPKIFAAHALQKDVKELTLIPMSPLKVLLPRKPAGLLGSYPLSFR